MSGDLSRNRRGPRRLLTVELCARIIGMYQRGMSLDAIGLEIGTSGHFARTILAEHGVEIRPRGASGAGVDNLKFVPHRDRAWRPEGDAA